MEKEAAKRNSEEKSTSAGGDGDEAKSSNQNEENDKSGNANGDKKDADVEHITSYTSVRDDSDSESGSDDNGDDESKSNSPPTTTTTTTTAAASSTTLVKKPIKFDSDSETDEKAEQAKSYKNVLSKLSMKNSSSPSKKTPIIKAGQTAKERDDGVGGSSSGAGGKMSFIGPKLPLGSKTRDHQVVTPSGSNEDNTKAAASTTISAANGEGGSSNGDTEAAAAAQKELNYSKDELAKYDHLLRMSQYYAKYNQV